MKENYTINLYSPSDYDEIIKDLSNLEQKLKNQELLNFIADKCLLEINRISNERLSSVSDSDVSSTEVNQYRSNHKVQVNGDVIIISNNTMADLSNVSEETLKNYPNGLSIAKVIEFGTGILGTDNDYFGWKTQVNPSRDYVKPWHYERDGKLYWSIGFSGRFIYNELLNVVERKFNQWMKEFLENE